MINMTLEQYIKQNCEIRERSDVDLICIKEEGVKHDITVIHDEVCSRMKFSIPLHFVNSYDVNSYILPFNGKYYHIIDIATFGYFFEFLHAMEMDSPNYLVFIYRLLKQDISLSKKNDMMAKLYNPKAIYLNPYEMQNNLEPRYMSDLEVERFRCMVRFYFLHEYAHYYFENPVRNSSNAFADSVIEEFFENLSSKKHSKLKKGVGKLIQRKLVKDYKKQWERDLELREEVYCDFQALLCLLELPGIFDNINVELIFESVMDFMYIQHITWIAKNVDVSLKTADAFSFRHNVIAMFAMLLEDKEYADLLCQILQSNNRFFVPSNLQTRPMYWEKQQKFYEYCVPIFMADKRKRIENSTYVFPHFI